MQSSKKKRIILICSDGGHLAQILELNEWFAKYDYLLVTEKSEATLPLEEQYNIAYLRGRSKGKRRDFNFFLILIFNSFLSLKLLISHYPKMIITTGSHTAIPMCMLGRLFAVKVVYILSFARISSKAFSANIIYPIANKFLVQWPGMKKYYKKGIYLGGIY